MNGQYSTTGTLWKSAGDKVVFGGESFYVLHDVYDSQSLVELFAVTNLNSEATKQANSIRANTACKFAESQYWGDKTGLNFNLVSGYALSDAIGRAKQYAMNKGAINGRLLTSSEANELKMLVGSNTSSNMYKMLYGTENTEQGHEVYWTASGDKYRSNWLDFVVGDREDIYGSNFDSYHEMGWGVRPVLTVLKSQIS